MTGVAAPPAGRSLAGAPPSAGALAGLGLAVRLTLRRNRWFWLVWVLALWVLLPSTASRYAELVPDTEAGRLTTAALADNPTMRALLGPPFDLLNAGGFTMWRVGTFVAAAAGVMAALGVLRATRAEEEDGHTELLRSAAIGRHALLAAAVLVAFGACLVLALLVTTSMASAAPPVAGAVATGLGIGLTGAVFVGVGAVAAQLSESARTARGIAVGTLGAAYLLRALADGSAATSFLRPLQWLSPVEWAALARPYAGERWAVLALPAALAAALVWTAFRLEGVRDHGAGVRAARPGPAEAAPSLSSAAGLAARLHRGTVVGWTVGIAVSSLGLGSLSGSLETVGVDNPAVGDMLRRMGGGTQALQDAFTVAMLGILAVVLGLLGLQILGRLAREEDQGHAEAMLATATSRTSLAASHLVPALVVPTLLLALTGLLLALPQAAADGSGAAVGSTVGAALTLAPGVWLVVGLAMALHGWAPRLRVLPWVVLGWSLFVVWLGAVLDLPQAALDATPFTSLPQLPAEPFDVVPVLAVSAAALLLLLAGLVGFRRRDLATS